MQPNDLKPKIKRMTLGEKYNIKDVFHLLKVGMKIETNADGMTRCELPLKGVVGEVLAKPDKDEKFYVYVHSNSPHHSGKHGEVLPVSTGHRCSWLVLPGAGYVRLLEPFGEKGVLLVQEGMGGKLYVINS